VFIIKLVCRKENQHSSLQWVTGTQLIRSKEINLLEKRVTGKGNDAVDKGDYILDCH